jgi:dodecin
MSVVHEIELYSESDKSWEDAARQVVAQATTTIRNLKSIYINQKSTRMDNGKVVGYCICAKVSFLIEQ